jgi:hypothetical protein
MRWDGDERGEGIADAAQFADGAAELLAAMQRTGTRRWHSRSSPGIVDEAPFDPHGHTLRLSVATGLR